MALRWTYGSYHDQPAYLSACGAYAVFWSDDACAYLADAPGTNSHGGWETAREAKAAMQRYEDNGRKHETEGRK